MNRFGGWQQARELALSFAIVLAIVWAANAYWLSRFPPGLISEDEAIHRVEVMEGTCHGCARVTGAALDNCPRDWPAPTGCPPGRTGRFWLVRLNTGTTVAIDPGTGSYGGQFPPPLGCCGT